MFDSLKVLSRRFEPMPAPQVRHEQMRDCDTFMAGQLRWGFICPADESESEPPGRGILGFQERVFYEAHQYPTPRTAQAITGRPFRHAGPSAQSEPQGWAIIPP